MKTFPFYQHGHHIYFLWRLFQNFVAAEVTRLKLKSIWSLLTSAATVLKLALCVALLLLASFAAQAHTQSIAYLTLHSATTSLDGEWHLSLRDLEDAVGLDVNDDGAITWAELLSRKETVTAYALSRLHIRGDGRMETLRIRELLVENHSDGAYAVLRFDIAGTPLPTKLELSYNAFFDIDPKHRGLLRLEENGSARLAVFDPKTARQTFDLKMPAPRAPFRTFLLEGVWHIWSGYDHILFLFALLLPGVLRRGENSPNDSRIERLNRSAACPKPQRVAMSKPRANCEVGSSSDALRVGTTRAPVQGEWQPVAAARPAFVNVLKIVTAFTLAHSITLSLAALGFVHLPTRLVESAIAASVVLVAFNNLMPFFAERGWLVAFGFGLLHGFGFANALRDLGLHSGQLAATLFGFNLGVELGQLAIVGALLPLALSLRHLMFYRRVVLRIGSVAIMLVASAWLAERVLDFKWLPF